VSFEKTLNAMLHLGALKKNLQIKQLLSWSGMTNTEHTTSDSNEEARAMFSFAFIPFYFVISFIAAAPCRR